MNEKQPLSVDELVKLSHERSVEKGFYAIPEGMNIPLKLALIHSEISEALEEFRSCGDPLFIREVNGKPEGFLVELADAYIRISDLIGFLRATGVPFGQDVPLFSEIIENKMNYNQTRKKLHGKNF